MTISPIPIIFWAAFFLLLTLCGQLHIHSSKGLIGSALGAALIVLLSRPWWIRGMRPLQRPSQSFRDPSFGSRAERRAAKRREDKRRENNRHSK